MGNTQPRVLNLDELETTKTDISITHNGVEHEMVKLTVERFILQQKRAVTHQQLTSGEAPLTDQDDVADVVTVMRDAVHEFFPTLPVDELTVEKLFAVFGWLNTLGDIAEGDDEGNAKPAKAKRASSRK